MKTAIVSLAIVAIALLACKNSEPTKSESPAPEPAAATPVEAPKSPIQLVREKETLNEAIAYTKPMMTDTKDEISPGAAVLTAWATTHLTWKDLTSLSSKATVKRVMKDSDEERGKLMCERGSVIEIHADSSLSEKVYVGGMFTNSGDILRFVAVKSTGDLVERSPARFCGVVIGRQDYANSVGGVAHAVYLVGMFDLPENK